MEFKINREKLIKLVDATKTIASARNKNIYVPENCGVNLQSQGHLLLVSARDSYDVMLTLGPVDIEESVNDWETGVTVDFKNLMIILKSMPHENIEIALRSEVLTVGGVDLQVKEKEVQHPLVKYDPDASFNKINRASLLRILEGTLVSVSTDETRPHLNGVLLNVGRNYIEGVSTDGHRMSHVSFLRRPEDILEKNPLIIPTYGVKEAIKMLKRNKDLSDTYIIGNPSYFILSCGYERLEVGCIEGKFPHWEKSIPAYGTGKSCLTMDRGDLLKTIKSATVSTIKKSTKNVEHLKLSFNWRKLNLKYLIKDYKSHSKLYERETKLLDVNYKGNDLSILFDAKYLLEAVKSMDDGVVELLFGDKNQPVVLKQSGHNHVLMPVRGE